MKISAVVCLVISLTCIFPVAISASEMKPISARFGYFNFSAIEEKIPGSQSEKKKKITDSVIKAAIGKVDIVLDGSGVFFGADNIVKSAIDLSVEVCEQLGVEPIKAYSDVKTAATQTRRVSYFDFQHIEKTIPAAVAAKEFKESAEETLRKEIDQANAALQEASKQGTNQEALQRLATELQANIVEHQQTLAKQSADKTKEFHDLLSKAITAVAQRHNTELVFTSQSLFAGQDIVNSNAQDLSDEIVVATKDNTQFGKSPSPSSSDDLQNEIERVTRKIQRDNSDMESYLYRSLCHLAKDETALAYQDAKRVLDNTSGKERNAQEQYKLQSAVILMSLALEKRGERVDAASLLAQAKTRCMKGLWPYPIIQYLNGERVESLIVPPDSKAAVEKNVYIAFKKLLQGKSDEALANFRSAQKSQATANSVDFKKVATAMIFILTH